MELWIDITFAWVALILSFLLVVIWALRLICKNKKPRFLYSVNRWLRKHHKLIGILMIATALIHGLFSSDALLSLNWGTATWIVSILLGLSFFLRKKLNMKKTWMTYHRLLTFAFVVLIIVHIVNVGGFILDDMISRAMPKVQQQESVEQTTDVTTETTDTSQNLPTLSPPSETVTPAESEMPTASVPPTESNIPTETDIGTASDTTYIDGVYEGTGIGYHPGLVVEVVIQDDQIESVTVIDHNEKNEMFWGVPVEVIPEAIVAAQSTDVDSISGATMTSEGIKEAVEDALSQALAG